MDKFVKYYWKKAWKLNLLWFVLNGSYDRAWFSPPCTSFSIASCSHHWRVISEGNKLRWYMPVSEEARRGLLMLDNCIHWIANNNPKKWYIENP